jgi:hypothetical protein
MPYLKLYLGLLLDLFHKRGSIENVPSIGWRRGSSGV